MYLSPQEVTFYLFAFISGLYVIHLGLYLISANFYDIWQSRRLSERYYKYHQKRQNTPSHKHPGQHNLVSIIISAHNEEKVIVRCLNSIRQSSYPNIEVLIADDGSIDKTKQLVRDYIIRHPEMDLRVYRMRRNIGKGAALNVLLKRHVRGEFVMTLDADSVLRPDTVTHAIAYFADPNIAGVAANVRIIDEQTILGVLQKFEHMVGYRSKKMYSLLNCEFVVGGVASSYRMDVLRTVGFYDTDTVTEDIGLSIKITSLGNQTHRMVYAANVVAMTEGVSTFRALVRQRYRWKYGSFQNLIKYRSLFFNLSSRYSRTLTCYRIPMALISEFGLLMAPLAWGYVIYMTFVQYNPTLIIGAYATITLYMLLTIWFDENLRPIGRLKLSGYALISYFIFFIMDLVQLIGITRCVWHTQSLLLQKNIGSSWVSPSRIGKRMRHIYDT
jgi:cellulose synthase/poly-beta-1,6-N-acetylglucosamine synthase-like glycosyltransferase